MVWRQFRAGSRIGARCGRFPRLVPVRAEREFLGWASRKASGGLEPRDKQRLASQRPNLRMNLPNFVRNPAVYLIAAVRLALAGVVYSQTGSRPIVDSRPEARPLAP